MVDFAKVEKNYFGVVVGGELRGGWRAAAA